MNRLVFTIAMALEPAIIKAMVAPPGKELTASEMAAIQSEHSAVPRRIAEQIVVTVRNALERDQRLIEEMCEAHDKEDSAQRGEPSPWADWMVREHIEQNGQKAHDEWVAERRAAMLAALRAVGLAP